LRKAISRAPIISGYDLRPKIAKLKVPALVVEGEKTNVALDATREWARAAPETRLLKWF
jgi:hypothetical protein